VPLLGPADRSSPAYTRGTRSTQLRRLGQSAQTFEGRLQRTAGLRHSVNRRVQGPNYPLLRLGVRFTWRWPLLLRLANKPNTDGTVRWGPVTHGEPDRATDTCGRTWLVKQRRKFGVNSTAT
jgi:hypothetical protein